MNARELLLFGAIGLILATGVSTPKAITRISSEIFNKVPDPRGAVISGHVYQVNGQPISEATIQVIRMDDEGGRETTTLSDGSYRATGLHPGDYKLRAFKQGFAREYYDNVVFSNEATIVHITTTDEITGFDFVLTEGGSISGYVYNNETGEPIEGAWISVVSSSEWADDEFHTVTDSNGGYKIDSLALGVYRVCAQASGFVTQCYGKAYSIDFASDVGVTPPYNKPNVNISLSRGGSISGYVFDANGSPVQGAQVGAGAQFPNGDWIGGGAETTASGSYIITDLPASNYYEISAGKQGFAPEWYDSKNTGPTADHVVVTEGNDTSGINFTLDVGGSITGYVYDEGDGTPISGIWFFVDLLTDENVGVFGGTNYDGSYTIWLGAGSYLISTDISGRGYKYIREWYDNSYDMEHATVINVTASQETSGIDFHLSKAGSISGHIYGDTGESIGNASVYAFSDIFPGSGANSQSDGCYVIEGLPSGIYSVQVSVTGYILESIEDVVVDAPSDTSGVNFALKKIMPADFDMNLHVDFADYAVLANYWMSQNCNEPNCCDGTDLNKDSSLDWLDLAQFTENWLAGAR